MSSYSSKIVEKTVNEFAKLPGVGRRTALRLVLHLLKQEKEEVKKFGMSVIELVNEVVYCKICHNISDSEVCHICSDNSRDKSVICIVEDIRDVIAIENTNQYRGIYHVLGGIISPIAGTGPSDLNIDSFVQKVAEGDIHEVIFALSATMEGDTTNYYIYRKIKDFNIVVTTIARGISVGDELEYTDEITLGRSIVGRVLFEKK